MHRPLSLLALFLLFLFACSDQAAEKELEAEMAGPTRDFQTFRSFDGEIIAYRDEGEGEPILLLHGFINNSESWNTAALYPLLLEQGYRVIRPDMRGTGNSAKPQQEEAYTNDAEIKDLIALADHLELKSYKAVGYSRGSILLAKLLTQDNRISKAVLGGMGLDFTNPEWDRRKAFALAFGDPPVLTEMTRGAVNYAQSINADFRSLHLQQLHQPVTEPDALRKVSVPILVVAGNEDKDNGDPGALEQLFPDGKLTIVPGDHNSTYKAPIFATAVFAFLKG